MENSPRYKITPSLPKELIDELERFQEKTKRKKNIQDYPMSWVIEELLNKGFALTSLLEISDERLATETFISIWKESRGKR